MSQSAGISLPRRLPRYVWRHTGRPLLETLRASARILRNGLRWRSGVADHSRWSSPQGLEQWWDERTQRIALLLPTDSRIVEFGAGRQQLKRFLPPGSSYTPSDLVDRGPGTIVCDLNQRPLPALSHLAPQVAVFGGVLEYIRDVPSLLQWIAGEGIETCIASFDPLPQKLGPIRRYREVARRTYFGYMNLLTEPELLHSFEAAGFRCTLRQSWTSQVLFRFQKHN